jgi:hypothetical protein
MTLTSGTKLGPYEIESYAYRFRRVLTNLYLAAGLR